MTKDIPAAAVLALWVISTALAYILGVYTVYYYDREHITEQEYREQSLQYLEDIRNSTADTFAILVQ